MALTEIFSNTFWKKKIVFYIDSLFLVSLYGKTKKNKRIAKINASHV